jgi:hypothetical protein
MSKPRKKKTGGDPYRRGYANGVQAAVEALFDDLHEHGMLDDLEYTECEDGQERATMCNRCVLSAHHFPRLADRYGFVMGLERHPHGYEAAT